MNRWALERGFCRDTFLTIKSRHKSLACYWPVNEQPKIKVYWFRPSLSKSFGRQKIWLKPLTTVLSNLKVESVRFCLCEPQTKRQNDFKLQSALLIHWPCMNLANSSATHDHLQRFGQKFRPANLAKIKL